jgi:hypothetical protein
VQILRAILPAEDEVKVYLAETAAQLVLVPQHRATAIEFGTLDILLSLSGHPKREIRNAVARTLVNLV